MRLASNLRMRRSFLFAVLIISPGLGVMGASVSAAEPAQLVTLSGDVAALLRTLYKPSVPVLVAGAGEDVVAIVFDPDPQEAARLRRNLFSTESVEGEGCGGDGPVACCDKKTREVVLSATYDDQRGWVQMGELCEIPDLETVDYIPVPEEVSWELNGRFGVDYCFMELAGAGGEPLVLVNAPSQDSPLWAYCLMVLAGAEGVLPTLDRPRAQGGALWLTSSIMGRATVRATSPTILAADGPRCQSQRPNYCIDKGYKVCRKNMERWYKENAQGKWCRMSTSCRCDD